MRRRWMGDWRPGMPQEVGGLILLAFTIQMVFRGLDYLTGDADGVTSGLDVVEHAMPLWLWGTLFVLAGLIVLSGMLFRRPWVIIYGAICGMALYGGLSWGFALRMMERGWPWDGWRTPTGMLMAAVFWGLIAYGTHVMMLARATDSEEDAKDG